MVRIRICARLALVLLGLAAAPGHAESVAVNGTLTPIALEDQHGRPGGVDAATCVLLLSRGMDGGSLVREVLGTHGTARLEQAGAVYIADVHAMPGPIRRFIAIPRMRELPYPGLLDSEGEDSGGPGSPLGEAGSEPPPGTSEPIGRCPASNLHESGPLAGAGAVPSALRFADGRYVLHGMRGRERGRGAGFGSAPRSRGRCH